MPKRRACSHSEYAEKGIDSRRCSAHPPPPGGEDVLGLHLHNDCSTLWLLNTLGLGARKYRGCLIVTQRRSSLVQVSIVVSASSMSVGDALRAMDSKGGIGSDFVLLSGDVVTNLDLATPLAQHKARRDQDRNAIMTLVRSFASPPSRPRNHLRFIYF